MAEADEARYLTDITWNYWRDKGIKPRITWIELKHVADFFIKECKKRGIDPQTVDFRDLIAEAGLSYEEHIDKVKEVLDSIVAAPPEPIVVGLSEALAKLEDLGIRLKEEELKKIEDVQKFEEAIERLKRNLERTKRELEEEKRRREEAERKLEEEKRKAKTIRIRFVKDHLPWYRKDAVIETDDFEWAMGLVNKGIAERVTPEVPLHVPPKPKELTKDEIAKLEDLFKATLFRELGRIPRDAMSEFRVELETVKMLPYEEALKVIERLAKDIAERVRRVEVPVAPPAPPVPPPVPREVVKPPAVPLDLMSFPRRLSSAEINAFWRAFESELASVGLRAEEFMEYWIRFRDAWHQDWHHVLRAFKEMIDDIKTWKEPRYYPRTLTPVWKNLPRDAILHLLATKVPQSMDDLIAQLNMHGVYVMPQEVTLIVKEEWKKTPRDSWLEVTPRDYIKKVLGVDPEDP